MSPRDRSRATPLREAQDRTIRALLSLVDDLTVERDEDGLLRSTLGHVVRTLGLSGGVTLLVSHDEELVPAAEFQFPRGALELAVDLAQSSFEQGQPLVRERPEGGWLAVALLRTQQRPLGVQPVH
jgi:hypothetical protein